MSDKKKRASPRSRLDASVPASLPVKVPEPPSAPAPEPVVVGIGASAGGLAAFEAFFSALPAEAAELMAFVLVQHLAPDHASILSELVRRYTAMPVFDVEDGTQVHAGSVYIIPPNKDMELHGNTLRLYSPTTQLGLRLTIDVFFRSLAREKHERAVGIILSGSGTDGTRGVRSIKGEGGTILVQAPESTPHDGMPRSAIATGFVDYVVPPAELARQLVKYVRRVSRKPRVPPGAPVRDDESVKRICALLRAHTGHDFSQYKMTTLVRRMERRMNLLQIEALDAYAGFARENVNELDALFRDLLIGVTNFFRDPEAFKVLEEKVIPRIFSQKAAHDPIRVWVCGCSTGEEAYSLAILLHEQLDELKRSYKVQVFATDIDRNAIEQARSGVFPASIAADVSPERLARFFMHDAERDVYRVQKSVRDLIVFSEQDVIKDPPFSKLDLISCRNLLIYLNPEIQRKLIPLFHYSLNPGGYLFLGTSETIGEHARLYSIVDRKWKITVRQPVDSAGLRPALNEMVLPFYDVADRRRTGPVAEMHDHGQSLRQLTEHELLAHYGPAGVLINSRGEILHIVGRTGNYLEPSSGDAAMNILAMARDGLRRELTTALHKAVAQKQPVTYHGLRVRTNGHHIVANVTVRPLGSQAPADMYLVILQEVPEAVQPTDGATPWAASEVGGRVAELEQELRSKEEYLQTTLEEMETTNEELKSTNEEMQSVNEELQSTNEELETSKEELQSVNEELSTVNAELQDKVADLSRANNDMNNLLAGTGVGTLFVDHHLRISRFTPAATHAINLIPADVGRPVEHVVPNFVGYNRLVEDTREVLDTLMPKEAEVQIKSGAWYLMRIRPYRTMDNVIEGVVLTLVDISERKRIEESLRAAEAQFATVVNHASAGLTQIDRSGRFMLVNDRFCELVERTRDELLQMKVEDVIPPGETGYLEALHGAPDRHRRTRYRRRTGEMLEVDERIAAVHATDGSIESLVVLSLLPESMS